MSEEHIMKRGDPAPANLKVIPSDGWRQPGDSLAPQTHLREEQHAKSEGFP